jgi:integrase/recombinase XerD
MSHPIAPHITAFLREHLPKTRDASPHTCDSYAYAFLLLFRFAASRLKVSPSKLTIEQIDVPLILAFLDNLEGARRNAASSRNARLAAIKSFFRFVEFRVPSALDHVRRVMAIPLKRTTSRLVAHLDCEEAQAIVDAPPPSTWMGIRDRAMLHIATAAGIRVSELIGLRCDDLILDPWPAIRIRGKGRRERVLPLWKQTTTALRRWLGVRGQVSVPELFVNARGFALSRSGVEYLLSKYAKEAQAKHPSLKSKRLSPHVLRHTCAMRTLQATGDVRKVALWLGHASVKTSEIYLRADPKEKLDAITSVMPLGLRPGRFRPPDELIASLQSTRKARTTSE